MKKIRKRQPKIRVKINGSGWHKISPNKIEKFLRNEKNKIVFDEKD